MMLYVFWNRLFITEICTSETMFQICLRAMSLLTLAVFPSVLVITESENLLDNFRLHEAESTHSEMSCLVISSSDYFMTPSEWSELDQVNFDIFILTDFVCDGECGALQTLVCKFGSFKNLSKCHQQKHILLCLNLVQQRICFKLWSCCFL